MKTFRKGQLVKFDILSIKWHGAKVVLSTQKEQTLPFPHTEYAQHTILSDGLKQKFGNARNEAVLILGGPKSVKNGTYYKVFIFSEYFWINDVHLMKFSE